MLVVAKTGNTHQAKRKVTSVILFFISLGSKDAAFLDYIVFSALLVHLVYHRYTNAIFVVDS